MSSRGIGGWIWSVSFSLWTLSTVYLCDWVNTSWAVCSDQPGVLQWFHLLIWICILFVPIWSQYTVPHSDPSLVSILFEHIILKLMCFLWNSGHFSSHFRTFLVEFCRDRRLRAFFVNSGLFSSHFRTFIVEFCRDRRLRAFPKILKILASSLFSLPCLTIFLTLFEPNSEWHPCHCEPIHPLKERDLGHKVISTYICWIFSTKRGQICHKNSYKNIFVTTRPNPLTFGSIVRFWGDASLRIFVSLLS